MSIKLKFFFFFFFCICIGASFLLGLDSTFRDPVSIAFSESPWGYPEREKGLFKGVLEYNEDFFRIFPKPKNKKKQHLIIAGGSNAFGDYLKPDESIAHYLYKHDEFQSTDIYINAFPGWGIGNINAFYQHFDLKKRISLEEGIYIYYMYWHHLLRTCGDDTAWAYNNGLAPVYQYSSTGELIPIGFQRDLLAYKFYRFRLGLLRLLGKKSKNVSFGNFKHRMNTISDDCFKMNIDLVNKVKRYYKNKFPKGKFYVLNLPLLYEPTADQEATLRRLLKSRNINYLPINQNSFKDYKSLVKNYHATKEYNEIMAEELKTTLREKNFID